MAFQPLSYAHAFVINNYPKKWLPFLYVYDPDIPLFPLHYIHILIEPEDYSQNNRVYGFINQFTHDGADLEVTLILNKDLTNNPHERNLVENEIKERVGLGNPVTRNDISNAFTGALLNRNGFLLALWDKIVPRHYGGTLPFGRLYDKVFGFIRFIASWNSPAGRRSELIQTHYFVNKFGERIPISNNLPQIFFFLLPSSQEFYSNNFTHFPKFDDLSQACEDFVNRYSQVQNVGHGTHLLNFSNPLGGAVNTHDILQYIHNCNAGSTESLLETFNAFDKGPPRTVRFIQMFCDLKNQRLNPANLTAQGIESIYRNATGFHQTTKVIALYSQQCFGNVVAFPIDLWMKALLDWPLDIRTAGLRDYYRIFRYSTNLGKIERLLWIVTQARKIHSPICDDAVWCIKKSSNKRARGANPLACGACDINIRNVCPAYARIRNTVVIFNNQGNPSHQYIINTSAQNNHQQNQLFISCEGPQRARARGTILDDFTAVDFRQAFRMYPRPNHAGAPIQVHDFISTYC